MIIDFRETEEGYTTSADICIVGTGVAGLTLARELLKTGLKICLVESGGEDFDRDTQDLYDGEVTGRTYSPLKKSRLRFFGGTTAIWGGRCVPLDPIDFEPRPGICETGWPFRIDALSEYYAKANEHFELPFDVYDERLWEKTNINPPAFDHDQIRSGFWQFDDKYWRFGLAQCRDLTEHPRVEVLLHANVVNIDTNDNTHKITQLQIASLNGKRGAIKARKFVLACGGIENARLLLAADQINPQGLGNDHDQVGRYFMEHPRARIGTLKLQDPVSFWLTYRKHFLRGGHKVIPALRLGEKIQRETRALNSAMTIKFQVSPEKGVTSSKALYDTILKRSSPNRFMRRIWRYQRRTTDFFSSLGVRDLAKRQMKAGKGDLYLIGRAEQAPNPDSRIMLSSERDALGMRKSVLDWRLLPVDTHSLRVLADTFDGELRRINLGSVEKSNWLETDTVDWPIDPTIGRHPIGGYHHMGTTRMADDARQGVVDAQCCVHGIDNLYIAGSSVFPTSGWANPTLTIVAMTLRLADHLADKMSTT